MRYSVIFGKSVRWRVGLSNFDDKGVNVTLNEAKNDMVFLILDIPSKAMGLKFRNCIL